MAWRKRLVCWLGLILLGGSLGWAQVPADSVGGTAPDTTQAPPPRFEYDVGVGAGLTWIENAVGDRERFFAATLMPEFSYGRFGMGFWLRLRLNAGGLRDEDFDAFTDYLGIIRYVRLGEKGDPEFYGRVGDLEEAKLGYGQFVHLYTNTVSLDDPKRGFVLDYQEGPYQFESVYSNFVAAEVFGLRGAYQPFVASPDPMLQKLTLGASLVGDLSNDGTLINPEHPGAPVFVDSLPQVPLPYEPTFGTDDGNLMMLGLDAGFPIRETEDESLLAYLELAKIVSFGAGLTIGVEGEKRFEQGDRLEGQIAQRVLGEEYLPTYFGALYEVERVQEVRIETEAGETLTALNTKRNRLAAREGLQLGSHVSLSWHHQGRFRLVWSFEHVWNEANSGWFHLDTRLRSPEWPLYLRVVYDRINVGALGDIVDVSREDALLRLEIAYRVWKFVRLGFDFRQSFEPRKQQGLVVGQSKRERIEPLVQVVIQQ